MIHNVICEIVKKKLVFKYFLCWICCHYTVNVVYFDFQVMNFTNTYYQANRMAVVASGIESSICRDLAGMLKTVETGRQPNDEKAQYFGGKSSLI